jgi:hypothetical protein
MYQEKLMKNRVLPVSLALVISFFCIPVFSATLEEKLEILQREIDELREEVVRLKAGQPPASPKQQAEPDGGQAVPSPTASSAAVGSATTLGGYGELIYNNYRDEEKKDQLDFRRFVLFLGHKFNDRLRLYSELEVEHALVEGGEESGAVELEQAFLEYRINDALNLKAGAFLVPIGILNETHEPPTFFGVERNEVESRIIPSTWREAGIGVHGTVFKGLRYDAGVVSSLDAGKFARPDRAIRSMRTELSEASAHDFAFYGALNYRGVPGLLVGGGVFSGNTGQNGVTDSALKNVDARLTLWDVHAQYRLGGLDLQALYARGSLGDADKVSAAAIAREGDSALVAPKSFYGWYGQAAYRFALGEDKEIAPFVRYERYNTQDSVAKGFLADPKNNEKVTTFGLNFKLHPQVVLKADYQDFKEDNTKDRFNLGVGYMF